MKARRPASQHLVLVGGGHAHALVLRAIGMEPLPGVDVTVVAKEVEAPYSGMLPGFIAGHYSHAECHIDLVRLAAWAGVRLIHGEVIGVDRRQRQVLIKGRAPLGYDLLSLDVGITPKLDAIAGAAEYAIAVKPVTTFAPRWLALEADALRRDGPRRIALVGSGAAGFELVLAARHRLRERAGAAGIDPDAFRFALVGGSHLLASHNARTRRLAARVLADAGVDFIDSDPAVAIGPGGVTLASGRRVAADAVMVTTGAAPPALFARTDLPRDREGYLAVRPTLQVLDDDDVFAVGDCASVLEHPREKAGVFAVRQGPPLTENLRRRARGEPALPFVPQRHWLALLSTGRRHAIASRGPFAVAGDWVWHWKDRIDREFMEGFAGLTARHDPGDDAMRCAGCAAKLGPEPLARALTRADAIPPNTHAQGERTGGALCNRAGPEVCAQRAPPAGPRARDDAAIIDDGGTELRLESVDFFPAFWPDPYVVGEIAALHALGDILAMGGRPSHAQAIVVLPESGGRRGEEDLFQVLAGARAAFDAEGVALVGGHTSEGARLSVGFHVSGRVPRDRVLRKSGLRAGDALILTRPIGTAIAFAALARGLTGAAVISPVLAQMRRSQSALARILLASGARAATDVTGFGLAGHLIEMLEASGVAARIDLAAVPVYDGVLELARAGVASTLLPANLALASRLDAAVGCDAATLAILFDPQTAGGLLVGVPEHGARESVARLHAEGATAASIIGHVEACGPGAGPLVRLVGALGNVA